MGLFKNLFKPKDTIDTSEIVKQIDYKEGTLFAEDDTNKIYLDIEELGGFPYLKTNIIGDTVANIKRTGCSITFVFETDEITLGSDNTTIESTELENSGVYHTPIDFELDKIDAEKIQSQKINEVKFNFKNIISTFKTI